MTFTTGSQPLDVSRADSGLAEWSSRIKTLQTEGDADEEAEQQRLEEEIAAARLARQRRSHGLVYSSQFASSDGKGFSIPGRGRDDRGPPIKATLRDPLDEGVPSGALSALQIPTGLPSFKASTPNNRAPTISAQSSTSRAIPFSSPALPSHSPLIEKTRSTPKEPISLASFMGGHATGPRLNKHTPQTDISDPTQFNQYVRTDIPHPIFGSGGIAVALHPAKSHVIQEPRSPASQGAMSATSTQPPERRVAHYASSLVGEGGYRAREMNSEKETAKIQSTEYGSRERKLSKSSIARRYLEKLEERNTTTKEKESVDKQPFPSMSSFPRNTIDKSPARTPIHRPVTPRTPTSTTADAHRLESHTSVKEFSAAVTTSAAPSPVVTSQPTKSVAPMKVDSLGGRKSPAPSSIPATPVLARPIIPGVKVIASAPIISAPSDPAPAFAKFLTTKDPTPSISRLQGRGFVQSMVQVSTQLESTAQTQAEKPRPITPKKTSTVLERWPPTSISAPASPQPKHPKSNSTQNVPAPSPQTPVADQSALPLRIPLNKAPSPAVLLGQAVRGSSPLRQLDAPSSRPALLPVEPIRSAPIKLPGLGSATTMVVFKPDLGNSLGEPHAEVDELGVRKFSTVGRSGETSESFVPPSQGKPLTHPTKCRPRKPKKTESGMTSVRYIEGERVGIGLTYSTIPELGENQLKSKGNSIILTVDEQSEKGSHEGSIPPSTTDLAKNGAAKLLPLSPPRQRRIPTTGTRATVMDVAQALSTVRSEPGDHDAHTSPPTPHSDSTLRMPLSAQPEKRKSSYEKYSSFAMPPLQEEVTPTPSPVNSVGRQNFGNHSADAAHKPVVQNSPEIIHLVRKDVSLPRIDIYKLINYHEPIYCPPDDTHTISIEVLSIMGFTAIPVTEEKFIFYEYENLAIIHRAKLKSTGLVSTGLWCWRGKHSSFSNQEEEKLREMSRRYSVNSTIIQQNVEPAEFVHLIGGRLIIRQGSRAHWSVENTSMHVIRSSKGVTFVDEIDLGIRNLCSAFSYTVSMLNTFYVWHGCGAIHAERRAAMQYAQMLKTRANSGAIVELSEGQNDDDAMFWMILGDGGVERADHWRWRKSATTQDPKIWRVDSSRGSGAVFPVTSVWTESSPYSGVHIFDCIWEYFVLVGAEARNSRQDIRLALTVATDLSRCYAADRPFVPPVHVVILPSQLPLDLRMNFRDLDEVLLNGARIPDHMNILTSEEAWSHLRVENWNRADFEDDILPLGLGPHKHEYHIFS